MMPIFPTTVSSLTNTKQISSNMLAAEEQDFWFDAIDHVEIDETWFDVRDELSIQQKFAEEYTDSVIPLTDDCRRCVKQLIIMLGNLKQSELFSVGLSKILPGIPCNILAAAHSLYTAIYERRHIDSAVLQSLGLVSSCLPDDANVISRLAGFIQDTVMSWTDASFLNTSPDKNESDTQGYLFTALAITTVAVRYWIKDEGAPQRPIFRVPGFIANLLVRANIYWNAINSMVPNGSYPKKAETRLPAFEVDTCVEMTRDISVGTDSDIAARTSKTVITAFSSNSTAHSECFTKATVQNRAMETSSINYSLAEAAHILATEKLKRESGLSDLLYCNTDKIETHRQQNGQIITNTHINTKCDAVVYPTSIQERVTDIRINIEQPKTKLYSVAGNLNKENALPEGGSEITDKTAATSFFMLNQATHILYNIDQFISYYDPLKFPTTEAFALRGQRNAEKSVESNSPLKYRLHCTSEIKEANREIINFLQTHNFLEKRRHHKKEDLISAVANYLFATEQSDITENENKVAIIARKILASSGLYGGRKEDVISTEQAESAIRYWVFSNILGTSAEEYIARSIASGNNPSYYIVDSIHHLFSLQNLNGFVE